MGTIAQSMKCRAANIERLFGIGPVRREINEKLSKLSAQEKRIVTRRTVLSVNGDTQTALTPRMMRIFDRNNQGDTSWQQAFAAVMPGTVPVKGFVSRHSLVLGHAAFLGAAGLSAALFPEQASTAFEWFKNWTTNSPWTSSAIKFGLLGTYGDMLGARVGTGKWNFSPKDITLKAMYWSMAGLLIKGAFTVYFGGMDILAAKLPVLKFKICGQPILGAVITSWVLNFTFYPFLVHLHASYDQHADACKKDPSPKNAALESSRFLKDVITGQIFKIRRNGQPIEWVQTARTRWVPLHTVTPLLPQYLQPIYAALLSPVLGVDLGMRAATKAKDAAAKASSQN